MVPLSSGFIGWVLHKCNKSLWWSVFLAINIHLANWKVEGNWVLKSVNIYNPEFRVVIVSTLSGSGSAALEQPTCSCLARPWTSQKAPHQKRLAGQPAKLQGSRPVHCWRSYFLSPIPFTSLLGQLPRDADADRFVKVQRQPERVKLVCFLNMKVETSHLWNAIRDLGNK